MARRLVLSLAMSLDGFIADEDGGYAWIAGDGNRAHDAGEPWDYPAFLAGVDVVVMGRACHDQGMSKDFPGKTVLVATSQPRPDEGNVRFVADPVAAVRDALSGEGGDVFLFGGGILVEAFLATDLIDEFILGIVPALLGAGRRLFPGTHPATLLAFERLSVEEGVVVIRYRRRAGGAEGSAG
jgi:dihydrofolate reductase